MIEQGKLKIDDILRAVATYYGVGCEDILSKGQSKTLIRSRHVAIYLARALTHHSLPEIGRSFKRDHSSVLHAIRRIQTLLQSDEALKAEVELLMAQFSSRVQSRRVA